MSQIKQDEIVETGARLKHRLDSLTVQRDELKRKYDGYEQDCTFHAGYNLGHIEGRITVIEENLDVVQNAKLDEIKTPSSTETLEVLQFKAETGRSL